MPKIMKIAFVVCLLSILTKLVLAEQPLQEKSQPILVGVSLPLTGEAATYGTDIRNVFEFANQRIGNGQYKFVFEDDRCSGKLAATAAQKLVNVDKVKYVLGPVCSGAVLAAAPIFEKAKVLALTQGSAPALANAGDYIFRTFPNDAEAAKMLEGYVRKFHKNCGLVNEETEYAQAFGEAFSDAAIADHLAVSSVEFAPGSNDFRTLLLTLRKKGVDSLFINSQSEAGFSVVLTQLREGGWDVPVYGAYWPTSPSFIKSVGKLADGIVAVDLPSMETSLNAEGKKLYQQYLQQYGPLKSIEFLFTTSLEAFRVLHLAIQSGKDPQAYLYETTFHGAIDSYHFDRNGDIQGIKLELKRIEHGKPVVIEP